MKSFAPNRTAAQLFGLFSRDFRENLVIDGDGRRLIATAQTADIFYLDVCRMGTGESPDQIGTQFAGTVQVTTHIRADVNFSLGWGGQMKMGVEAGDAVKLIERSLRALRKCLQLRDWQIPEAQLDGSQFVEDHVDMSRETAPC